MSEYIFLYRGGKPTQPEEREKTMQQWMGWFKEMADKVVDRGQPLEPAGKIVRTGGGAVVDGPFAEAKDVIGGFTIVQAADLAAAAKLAEGCPILQRGGEVEVRPIMKMEM